VQANPESSSETTPLQASLDVLAAPGARDEAAARDGPLGQRGRDVAGEQCQLVLGQDSKRSAFHSGRNT